MNGDEILSRLKSAGLAAWQARFVLGFLSSGRHPHHLLVAPPGTGKSRAGAAVAAEMARAGSARVLVLVPAALRVQWSESVRRIAPGVEVRAVDRKGYRELVSSSTGKSAWSWPGVYVLGTEFARKPDIVSSLTNIRWDLVIVDEAHRLASPQISAFIRGLFEAGVAGRLLIMTATDSPSLRAWISNAVIIRPESDALALTGWTGPLAQWDGSIIDRPSILTHVVSYSRGDDERSFLNKLKVAVQALKQSDGLPAFYRRMLLTQASSSLLAADQFLRNLRLMVAGDQSAGKPGEGLNNDVESESSSGVEEISLPEVPPRSNPVSVATMSVIDECLDSLESVESDAKLDAAKALVEAIRQSHVQEPLRICVLTSFTDTGSYIASALNEMGLSIHKLIWVAPETWRDTQEQFRKTGGVLVCTDTYIDVVDLPAVQHVLHYDLPISRFTLEKRIGCFNRYGQVGPCTMYVFRDESGILKEETHLIEEVMLAESLLGARDTSDPTTQ